MAFLPLDVTDDESVADDGVRAVLDRSGRIDVLVNNAGIGSSGASEESSAAQDEIVFDVNVFGLIRMTKAVLPHMRAQNSGRIINMSSVGGFAPQPFMASYVASKHAVEGYSESVAASAPSRPEAARADVRPEFHPPRNPEQAAAREVVLTLS